MADELLPLFPLKVVLFPESALPLHIFEDRYKRLIRECLEAKGKEFGINFVDGEKPSMVGCTAAVREVVRRYEDGRLDIVVEGKRRYRLHHVDERIAPYLMGHVSFFTGEQNEVDVALAGETAVLYNKLIEAVYQNRLPRLSTDDQPQNISFVVAQKAGMNLQQRQELLEMKSENERLQVLLKHLTSVIPKLQQAQEIQRIAHCDGYITS